MVRIRATNSNITDNHHALASADPDIQWTHGHTDVGKEARAATADSIESAQTVDSASYTEACLRHSMCHSDSLPFPVTSPWSEINSGILR